MKHLIIRSFKKYFKYGLTLMVVPVSSNRQTKSWRIPFPLVLVILCFTGLNLYIFTAYSAQIWKINRFQQKISLQNEMISKYESEKSRYQTALQNSEILETKLAAFRQENQQMVETWKRIRQKDRLRFTVASRGSFRTTNETNIYKLTSLPNKGFVSPLEKLDHNINQLDEILNFETKDQEEILKELTAYERQLDHTPSIWPVYTRILSIFGSRFHPVWRKRITHEGVDLKASFGSKVRATADGIVTFAGWQGGYGNVVIISHDYGFETRYAHNSQLLVHQGQSVKKGQVICISGSTGVSTGPHLHYEVRINGSPANPVPFLKD